MGRKKIQISRITDERNRQVSNIFLFIFQLLYFTVNICMCRCRWGINVVLKNNGIDLFQYLTAEMKFEMLQKCLSSRSLISNHLRSINHTQKMQYF